jgi:hypothetical protein
MSQVSYCAIIGDMNRSRELPERKKIQRQFLRAVDQLNEEFKESIVSDFRFRVSEGDSFEGLLKSPVQSYRCARRLIELVLPISFSIGVGIGPVATELSRSVDVVDGEAFHRARNALALAKKSRQEIMFDFDAPAVTLVNALAGLVEKEWSRLTPRQREVIRCMNALANQERVARKLKISQPAVAKVLNVPTVRKMLEGELALHGFLASSF